MRHEFNLKRCLRRSKWIWKIGSSLAADTWENELYGRNLHGNI